MSDNKSQQKGGLFKLTPSELTISPVSSIFGIKRKANPAGVIDAIPRDSEGNKVLRTIRPLSPILPLSPISTELSPLNLHFLNSPIKQTVLWDSPPRHNPNSPTVITFDPTPPKNNIKLVHPFKGAYSPHNVSVTRTPIGTKITFGKKTKDKKDYDEAFRKTLASIAKPLHSITSTPIHTPHTPHSTWTWVGNNLKYNNILYSGSGVFLATTILKDGINKLCFLLFHNTAKNAYEDLGGGLATSLIPSSNTLANNAKKEVQEESSLTLNLDNLDLNRQINFQNTFVDSNFRDSKYRSHVVVANFDNVNNFFINYYNNTNKLKSVASSEYKETNDIKIFEARTLFNAVKHETGDRLISTQDINGFNYNITGRTVKCLKDILNNYDRNNSLLQTVATSRINLTPITITKFGQTFIQYKI